MGADRRRFAALALASLIAGCEKAPLDVDSAEAGAAPAGTASPMAFSATPIHELTTAWFGLPGYYYDGSNTPPPAHADLGALLTKAIEPVATDGSPLDPALGGRTVFLSMGFSNTNGKWCLRGSVDGVTCNAWSFMGRWRANSLMRQPGDGLQVFNGTTKGGTTPKWDDPADQEYENIAMALAAQGLSPYQVQVMYVEIVNPNPMISLPDPNADMYKLVVGGGNQMRAMKVRYPNLLMAFVSPRDYAGYSKGTLSREPFAYESAFAVKWLIQAQITQLATGVIDSLAGDLSLAVAPWLTWGPYTWATSTPRGDGLFWNPSHYDANDGVHFSKSGEIKAANFMIGWFSASPFAGCWLLKPYSCSSGGPKPPQVARPASLIANSGWRASSGTELWDMLDEDQADDGASMIATPLPPALAPGNSVTVGLGPLEDPVSGLGHVIRVRARKPSSGVRIDGSVELLQGSTTIATMSIPNLATNSWTEYSDTLTTAEADAITDYSALNLRITFWRSGTGASRVGTVTQASFEVPSP